MKQADENKGFDDSFKFNMWPSVSVFLLLLLLLLLFFCFFLNAEFEVRYTKAILLK